MKELELTKEMKKEIGKLEFYLGNVVFAQKK